MLALAASRRQDKPTPRFASGDLVHRRWFHPRGDDAVDLTRLECALLEHGSDRLKEFTPAYYTFQDAGAESEAIEFASTAMVNTAQINCCED